ncbi:S8 family serine peptidase [Catellatospora sichuanensis]|uniref:S8 family serine peptidase n=1 Tax=Catellatospora sichuanensis TaxID=1969805 RepID=UPI001642A27D|nr:S8 family serine peptidase [Catellatospora sichuanensis]
MNALLRRRGLAAVAALLAAAAPLAATPASAADRISDGQWYVDFLDLDVAHKVSRGDGVRIALIDTGVDARHPDLKGSVVAGADFSREGPGDGLTDTDGHGTSMASLIAGNGQIRGVAPDATIVSIRASNGTSSSATSIGQAVSWAADHDIPVISISSAHDSDDLVLQQAVQAAVAKDIVVVAGAGNTPRSSRVAYPAAYPGVIAVAGVGKKGEHSATSVTGPELALSAPSDMISTAYRDGQRVVATGTSNATALVAGTAALIRSKYPNLPASEVVRLLTETATDKGTPGRDSEFGYGVVNPVRALADAKAAKPSSQAQPSDSAAAVPTAIAAPGAEIGAGTLLALVLCGVLAVLAVVAAIVVFARSRRHK